MPRVFLDTNQFLRLLIKDVPDQHNQVLSLFEKGASGKADLFTSSLVFFEIFWVLASFYKQEKPLQIRYLESILRLAFIDFERRDLLETALALFSRTTLELEDCYNIAYARSAGYDSFATFDKKLLRHLH